MEICYICGMKKQKQFAISAQGAMLISKYSKTLADPDDLYVNPQLKRDNIRAAVQALENRVIQVSDSNPSFEEAAKMASDIAVQCMSSEAGPKYDQTKEQVYNSILAELQSLLETELLGKNICIKNGAYKFSYLKVNKVEARIWMHNQLQVWIFGPGMKVDLLYGDKYPVFDRMSTNCIDVLVSGKTNNRYGEKTWMYVLSDDEMKKQFETAFSDIASKVGMNNFKVEMHKLAEEKPNDDHCPVDRPQERQ